MADNKDKIAAARARKKIQADKKKSMLGPKLEIAKGNLADDASALLHFFTNPLMYTDPKRKFNLHRKK